MIPKVKMEMSEEEKRRMKVNGKALHMLFCALGPDMYSKMSLCTSAKEVCGTLETTYEGTNDVKQTKIGLLNLSYGNFKMEPDENATKIKRTTIIKAKDLKTLKLDALMGALFTHVIMKKGREEEKKRSWRRRRDRRKRYELLSKLHKKRMILRRRFQRKGDFKNKRKEEEKDQIIFYECKRPRHIRSECPQLKKKSFGKKKKLKAQIATWSDEESSDEEEQEVSNLCLMELEEDSKVTSNSSKCDLTFDELFEEYEELQEEEEYKNAYIEFLDKQQILLGCLSRTHELTNNLIYKAPRSNHQVPKRTPSFLGFLELTHQAKRPGENHNFDFQNMLCLNLESPQKISLRSLLSPPE
ncbi:hypothetical protein V6N12_011786 [Hibiscus sabdariffa]|uniref:Uncharacterized protein n=1 Tax=Hibiscus sabdariffa TaxID=183260 RepID=A0ABR2BTJ0_9ROSI